MHELLTAWQGSLVLAFGLLVVVVALAIAIFISALHRGREEGHRLRVRRPR